MSKLLETNELMLAIERLLISKLDATILGHGQAMSDDHMADFQAIIDGKTYSISIEQQENDDD